MPPTSADVQTGPVYVYRLYDRDGDLLYVGQSINPANRIRAHRSTQPWGHRIDHWTKEFHPNLTAALTAESAAIHQESPAENVHHNAPRETVWDIGPRVRAQMDAGVISATEAFELVMKHGVTARKAAHVMGLNRWPENSGLNRQQLASRYRSVEALLALNRLS